MGNKKSKLKLNKRRVIVLIVLALILALIIFGIVKLFSAIFAKEVSVGNKSNMGLVLEEGKTTYYNKYEKGIVKVKAGKEYQITDETAYSMTLVEDTIYYLTVSSQNSIVLKSVKTNGDKGKEIKVLSTPLSKFYIEDDFAYYVTNESTIGIAKLSLQTGEETIITASNVQDFVLEKGTIYYTDSVGYLHSVSTLGTDNKQIATEYNIKNIQIMKKWIYFYDSKENALCKIKKDGSSKKTVATFVNSEIYNITNKGIYYFDSVNKQICKSDLKGKKSKAIVSLDAVKPRINIANKEIYYLDNSKDPAQIYQMFRVKTNGNSAKSIEY